MTSHTCNVWIATVSGILLLATVLPMIFRKDQKWYKRITVIGWAMIVLTIAIGCLSVTSSNINERENNKKDSINNVQAIRYENKIDSLTAISWSIDSILRHGYNLTISRDSTGKVKITDNKPASPHNSNSYSSNKICPIRAYIRSNPNNEMQVLCNGDKIPSQYRVNKDGVSFTVPYMIGKDYAGSLIIDNIPLGDIGYDINSGTFDLSQIGSLHDGNNIVFNANLPAEDLKAVITVKLPKGTIATTTIKDAFFSKPITEIAYSSQNYIIGADFTQDTEAQTITFTNGNSVADGAVIVARR